MRFPKRIVIVTARNDLHADVVGAVLTAKGHPPFRIDLDAFPREYQMLQRCGDGGWSTEMRHLPTGDALDARAVGAVWLRKPADFAFRSTDLTPQERAYAKLETEQALFGWLYALDCHWMSHPVAVRGALWKGEQLQRAARHGFRVPRSIVTNVPEEVRAFRSLVEGDIVFKSMSTPQLAAEHVAPDERISAGLATTLLTEEMLDDLEAVREVPCHFQEYVPKQHELRVTLIGERLFAAKIHSQDDPRTAVDSRDLSAPIRYEPTELTAELSRRCRAFVASYGLTFGALDLIVTPAGEVVFLENNPVGQFLYVEQLAPELRMVAALADELIAGARCRT